MALLSLSDFQVIDKRFPRIRYHREDGRTTSNLYLFEHEGQRLLIDSGDGQDALPFVPDVVFLTHGHYDHTSGVEPGWPRVFISPSEDPALRFIRIPPNAQPLPSLAFDFGPFHFDILPTPGHTPGSICLFERTSGFLFSGDTKFAHGGRGRTDLGGSEKEIMESLEMLEHVPYTLLCPGHGDLEPKAPSSE